MDRQAGNDEQAARHAIRSMPFVRRFACCLGLALLTFAGYARVGQLDFVNFDDPAYVYENVHVRQGLWTGQSVAEQKGTVPFSSDENRDSPPVAPLRGLNWENVAWAFTTTHASNWHPVTWLSLMLDAQWFGPWAPGYHLVNLAFHVANVLLVFLLLEWMTGAFWPSATVAALFAVHPLHVESVAWVAERKDVLSTFWGLAALGAYVWYTRRPAVLRYLLVTAALAIGLMAKPMLVTWPCLMLLLDYWPLGRLGGKVGGTREPPQSVGSARPTLRIGPAVETVRQQAKKRRKRKDRGRSRSVDAPARAAVPVVSSTWPWRGFAVLALEKVPLVVLAILSSVVTFIVQSRGGSVMSLERADLATRVGGSLVAYVQYIGKTLWPLDLAVLYPYRGAASAAAVTLAIVLLAAISAAVGWGALGGRRYLAVGWLWYLGTLVPVIGLVPVGRHALADRYTYVPSIGLFIMAAWGIADLTSRWPRWQRLLAAPAVCVLLACSVLTAQQTGVWANSETLYRHALDVTKDNVVAHENLGVYLWSHGRTDEAKQQWETALRLRSSNAEVLANMANIYVQEKRFAEAATYLRRALELKPDSDAAHNTMAAVCLAQGNLPEALNHCLEAQRLRPDNPSILRNLSEIYRAENKLPDATAALRQLLKIMPEDISARDTLAVLLANQKQWNEAIDELHEVLRREPKDYFALNSLAWLLSTCPDAEIRNGREAVELAQRAVEGSRRRTPEILDTLAAAYAEAGRFPEAVDTAQQARTLAARQDNLELAARLLGRLELYRSGKPYREGKK